MDGTSAGGDGGGEGAGKPILIDLNDNGIEITQLNQSQMFLDMDGDGLLNRTAWAADGDGVLFYDLDDTGEIQEKRQIVFTEWDPTATSDIEALRSVFDSDADGDFDAHDAEFSKFKIMVTNPDGSTSAKTLAELGIVTIDLTADATHIELPDGSVITGQTTLTYTDGSTSTVADATLMGARDSQRVEQAESTDTDGNRVLLSTGYAADGAIAFVHRSVSAPDGSSVINSYDDDGDGVVDRLQVITTATNAGEKTETVLNLRGADANTAILENQTQTIRNADGSTVTIDRDSMGGGWYDQRETRLTQADGSLAITISDLAFDGSVIRSETRSHSVDGLSRTDASDLDGDALADRSTQQTIVINADGSRDESTTITNQDGSLRSVITEDTSADGQTRVISADLNGDGLSETVTTSDIVVDATGSTVSTATIRNQDGSTRSSTEQSQSADALSKTARLDRDGDSAFDSTTTDATILNADGSREQTVTTVAQDGSVLSGTKMTLGADKVTSDDWVDLDLNGTFDADELVRRTTVDQATGEGTTVAYDRSADGTIHATTTIVASQDGLASSTTLDADQDGSVDSTISDATIVNADGSTTRTITTTHQDGSLNNRSETFTSSDGLSITARLDLDGDGQNDQLTQDVRVLAVDGSTTRTVSNWAGDETTLLSEIVTVESADRRDVTITADSDGDGNADLITRTLEADDGSVTLTETVLHADGTTAGETVSVTNANGFGVVTTRDLDGDGDTDTEVTVTTTLASNGSTATETVVRNDDASLRSRTIETVNDDGLVSVAQVDSDGDGVFERTTTSTTTLANDGSRETITDTTAADGSLLGSARTHVNDDGLITADTIDTNGDGTGDLETVSTTVLGTDGSTTTTTMLTDLASSALRSNVSQFVSGNGRTTVREVDVNGDGSVDTSETIIVADNGIITTTAEALNADGTRQSLFETELSANGLTTITRADADGDGTFESSVEETSALNVDGSVTTTSQLIVADATIYESGSITVSGDGLTVTSTANLDHTGDVEFTTVASSDLAQDGTQTLETRTYGGAFGDPATADGPLIRFTGTTTSSDGRHVVEVLDVDGDGDNDAVLTTTIAVDGTVTSNAEFFDQQTGALAAVTTTTISGDGLTTTNSTDRDADGASEHTATETTVLGTDGSTSRVIEHRENVSASSAGTLTAVETISISDDGMSITRDFDQDGDGTTDLTLDDVTSYLSNGDMVVQETASDGSGGLISSRTTTMSGNALTETISTDLDGDGIADQLHTVQQAADGAIADTSIEYAADGIAETRRQETSVSADGRTTTSTVDVDGDGVVERSGTTTEDADRETTAVLRDLEADGSTAKDVTTTVSANGHVTQVSIDIDGDGQAELHRRTETSYDGSGNTVTLHEERFGASADTGTLAFREVSTTSATGLISTSVFDTDGDGVDDGTTTSTETIVDGQRTTVSETRYADGTLHARQVDDLSADGRTRTVTTDFDGDGETDQTVLSEIGSDGSVTVTTTVFDDAETHTTIVETTADGLLTTRTVDGVTQTTTRSPLNDGSYTWDNGAANSHEGGHILVAHTLAGDGIQTWSMSRDLNGTTTSHEVTLDAAGMERLLAEAARIYDTLLDRDMEIDEIEVLVAFTANGQLDQNALADHLIASDDFTIRFGTLTNAQFVARIYQNAFERAPDLDELDQHLRDLNDGSSSLSELALSVSESVEHIALGNRHQVTNNFDSVNKPAELERLLDRSYAEGVVKALFDVIYDRAAVPGELSFFSETLMTGADQVDDVVAAILTTHGNTAAATGVSLYGLSGTQLVTQAFQNAFGRAPTSTELQTWTDNLDDALVSEAEFIASLARSTEYLSLARSLSVTSPPANVIEGSELDDVVTGSAGVEVVFGYGGSDSLLGGDGNDFLAGGDGNDQIDAGDGNDTLDGSEGADSLNGGNGIDVLFGGDGDDLMFGGELAPSEQVEFNFAVENSDMFGSNHGWGNEQHEREIGDINGDGILDVIGFWSQGTQTSLGSTTGELTQAINASDGFGANHGWGNEQYERRIGDVDGDGFGDVVGFASDGTYVALGHEDGSFGDTFLAHQGYDSEAGWGNEQYERRVADVNGDGRDDIVGFASNGTYVALGNSSGTFGTALLATSQFGADSSWGDEQYEREVADVNGDGRADIVGFGSSATYVALGQTDGTFDPLFIATNQFASTSGWGLEIHERRVVDVNADGRADIVGFGQAGVHVAYANTDGTFANSFLALDAFGSSHGWGDEQFERRVGDMNGDGIADIIAFGSAETFIVLGSVEGAAVDFLYGGNGEDLLSGGYGNDSLIGGAEADSLVGGHGHDILGGGLGDDAMFGGNGADELSGGDGADELFGGGGNDTLGAGANHSGGWELLDGGSGHDTFEFSSENRNVLVTSDLSGSMNTARFTDIRIQDTQIRTFDYGAGSEHGLALEISWDDGGETGIVRFANEGADIASFEFADGTKVRSITADWVQQQNGDTNRTEDKLYGTSGNDTINGSLGSDNIEGGDGDDVLSAGSSDTVYWQYLYGQNGDDTYKIGKDNGIVFISFDSEGTDTIEFTDLALSDVNALTYDYGDGTFHGLALKITWDDGIDSGELRVSNMGDSIERYEFADGSTLSAIDADWVYQLNGDVSRTEDKLIGTDGDDLIVGTSGSDNIAGGDGNDTLNAGTTEYGFWQYLYGQNGDDTYQIDRNNGNVFISIDSAGTDRIVFRDLAYSEVTVSTFDFGAGTYHGTALSIHWDDGVDSGIMRTSQMGNHIEAFEFSDGTVLTYDEFF